MKCEIALLPYYRFAFDIRRMVSASLQRAFFIFIRAFRAIRMLKLHCNAKFQSVSYFIPLGTSLILMRQKRGLLASSLTGMPDIISLPVKHCASLSDAQSLTAY